MTFRTGRGAAVRRRFLAGASEGDADKQSAYARSTSALVTRLSKLSAPFTYTDQAVRGRGALVITWWLPTTPRRR